MKISDQRALELLEGVPLEQVSSERNFLAPLLTVGRTASIICDDPSYGRRLIAGELGTEDVWWEYEMDKVTGRLRVRGTVNEQSVPVKVVS